MAKIIVAIDVGDYGDNEILLNEWVEKELRDVVVKDMVNLKSGAIIALDEITLTRDREDDSFYEFEFRGWEP